MRNIFAYVVLLSICGGVLSLTIAVGQSMEMTHTAPSTLLHLTKTSSLTEGLRNNLRGSLGILLTQIIVVAAVARLLGLLALQVGQPYVVGEMLGGLLLGPSLLGFVSPGTMS